MSGKVNKIDYILAVMDQFTRPLKAFNDRVDDIVRPVKRVQHSLAAMGREAGFKRIAKQVDLVHKRLGGVLSLAGKVSGALAGVSAVAGWAVKTQLLDPAAQFETFLATLEQLEGGLVPAKKSMDWISNFAAKTPYELTQVTDSFVKLRAYGLDPTSGLLRTLGDTASSMGKDVMEAVEAIADAITGENERLKEFGIKASMAGGKITYEYTDKLGKQLTKTVDKSNRAMIQATLEGIWNEKYGGAMQKRMKTWDGMWSNMMDVLNRFRLKIMEFGAFDWMREKLAGVLATIEKMDKSGELDRWAKLIGERIVTGLQKLWEIGKALGSVLGTLFSWAQKLANLFGGWENLLTVLAVLLGVKMVVALGGLATAFYSLGVAIMTTPIGWFMAAVAAIVGVVALIVHNWEPIKGFFLGLFDSIAKGFKAYVDIMIAPWVAMFDFIKSGIGWVADAASGVGSMLGLGGDQPAGGRGASGEWGRAAANIGRTNEQRFSSETLTRNESKVSVDFNNLPRGTRVRQQGDAGVDMSMGWAMQGAG